MSAAPGRAKTGSSGHFSDSHLVQECLKGSEAAWSALIGKYKNLIFSIPVRYGLSEEDCADIFQAVCMDLLTELPRIREPNALAGWLIQVARNKCFHRRQAQENHPLQEIDESHSMNEPAHLIEDIEREQTLREALLYLPPRCQQLVQMLFFEVPARPYEQVSRELDLAEGSIGFIRRRCLNKLRQRLEQFGFHLP